MNKLMGFYELKSSGLPAIPWQEFKKGTALDDMKLWTIRTAVFKGNDLGLPRLVGGRAEECEVFARDVLDQVGENGIVIYYPFFVAEKSGTLHVFSDYSIIEAVNEDLWNLVSHSDCEVTIKIFDDNRMEATGNKDFIPARERDELQAWISKIRFLFRDEILEGKSILLEWSYAYNCDINRNKLGDKYLVFYEVRSV